MPMPLVVSLVGVSNRAYTLPTTNLLYDYDAASLTSIGNNNPIDTWTRAAGSGTGSLAGTGTQRPLLLTGVLNGYPVVRFDGSDDQLTGGDSTTTYSHFVIFAVQRIVSGNYPWSIGTTSSNSPTSRRIIWERGTFGGESDNRFDVAGDFGNDATATATGISASNVWRLYRIQVSGNIHATTVRFNNATSATMGTAGSNNAIVVPAFLNLGLTPGTGFASVDFARFAIYGGNGSAPISAITIGEIEAGLATQYGF